ncbi:MAG: ferrous iron transport protein A [Christensenellaceae bacterium]|jgi:ferrous iron transport protein A|nr:ferrous iron transport protein A [Christensenellaceae bacterium]
MGLHEVEAGGGARVLGVRGEDGMARRLADLGFTAGAWVRCLYKSPALDPAAYDIRGAVIALRREDAARIEVRP